MKKILLSCFLLLFSSSSYSSNKENKFIGFTEPKEIIDITSKINGQVSKWHLKEGETFQKGDLLVTLVDDKSYPSIISIEAQIDLAEKKLNSNKQLFKKKHISEIELLETVSNLETLKDSLERAKYIDKSKEIKAHFNGLISNIYINSSESISNGTSIAELYNHEYVNIYSNIYNIEKICKEKCVAYFEYQDQKYGPYAIDYKLKRLDKGYDITKVGVYLKNSPIPYGVTVNFYLKSEE